MNGTTLGVFLNVNRLTPEKSSEGRQEIGKPHSFLRRAQAGLWVLAGIFALAGCGGGHKSSSDDSSGREVVVISRASQDPAATQAELDALTPEAMRSATAMDADPEGVTAALGRLSPSQRTKATVIEMTPGGAQPATSTAPVAKTRDPGSSGSFDQPTDGLPSVGALFFNLGGYGGIKLERCTGTVLNTSSGQVVATAAHCLAFPGGPTSITTPNPIFVPGYHDGEAPYGKWAIDQGYVIKGWLGKDWAAYDYGFYVIKRSSDGRAVRDVVGGNNFKPDVGYNNDVEITAYPGNRDKPLQCFTSTQKFGDWVSQLVFNCDSFADGVSGALLMLDFDGKAGTAIATLGGYERGGTSDNTSYAVRWGQNTVGVIQTADAYAGSSYALSGGPESPQPASSR